MSYASQRDGHGLSVTVEAAKTRGTAIPAASLDVYGGIWGALGPGMSTAASWLCPLKLREWQPVAASASEIGMEITLGAFKLSHATVDKKLDLAIEQGDPIFMMDLCLEADASKVFCKIPTRCSLIKASLAASKAGGSQQTGNGKGGSKGKKGEKAPSARPPSIVYTGELPRALTRPRTGGWLRTTVAWLRWWSFALVFLAATWALALRPHGVLREIGASPFAAITAHGNGTASLAEALPPHPTTLSGAWDLSALEAQLRHLEALEAATEAAGGADGGAGAAEGGGGARGGAGQLELLRAAAVLVGRPASAPLSPHELHGVRDRIVELEAHRGVVTRVTGFFTFLNTIWLAAIIGIAASIGPSLYHILAPVRAWLLRAWKYAWEHAVEPALRRLHDAGAFEAAAFAACFAFVARGASFADPTVGLFVSLTGLVLLVPCAGYSTLRSGARPWRALGEDARVVLTGGYFCLAWAPMAVHFQSSLLGYMSVCALYAALGFSGCCFGLCYCIGWESEASMQRTAATSALLLAAFVASRGVCSEISSPALEGVLAPFGPAVGVMGGVTLFLALLIMSSYYYDYRGRSRTESTYWRRQAVMVVSLLAASSAGHMLGMPGLANTATTFGVLYTMQKWSEVHLELGKWNGWVLVLALSCATYKCALWLNLHPGFVASLFDAAGGAEPAAAKFLRG
jgi:hypothetical protein